MTNFEHLKEIINEDESIDSFLLSFLDDFCEDICPLNNYLTEKCSGDCKRGIFMWLIGNYNPDSYIWHIEE